MSLIPLALVGLAVAGEAAPAGTLEQAYQKEYAYLRAEKTELVDRVAELDREAAARVTAADAELEALQAQLVATSRRADRAEDAFDALDRETAAMDDAATLLSTTVQQATDTLGMESPADPTAAIPLLFAAAADQIDQANVAGWHDESFFLPDGTQVSGRVYTWGRIAAWGVSDAGSGSLAPVGQGQLQLRRAFGTTTAEALAAGQQPATLEVHLYEPERVTEEAEKAGGLQQLLKDAGAMGQLLFGLGMVSACLVVVRGITLAFARRGGQALITAVTEGVRVDRMESAHGLVVRRGGPTARVLRAILGSAHRSKEELDRVVDEAILRETPGIDRFASALVVITAGAPLLGLLGTVTGMIATFDVITEHGTGNPKLMSAGIAEALVCTALGLAVAIPTLLAGNVLASIADAIKNTIDRGSLAMLNALEDRERAIAAREVAEAEGPMRVVAND